MDADTYRRTSDELLRQATMASDLNERSRLIDEAVYWHRKAVEAAGPLPNLERWFQV